MSPKIPNDAVALFDPIRADMAALAKLNAELTFDYESPDGNKAARSHVWKLRQVKGRIAEAHKVAKADALAVCQALDAMKRDYTAEVESLISVHEKPILDIEEREARARVEAEEKARREKEEAERKAREELEAKQREIERKEREIAEREAAIRRREEDARCREQDEIARREAAEKAEAERIATEAKERADAEDAAKAEAERKAKAEALREQAIAEATDDVADVIGIGIPSKEIIQKIIAGNVRHVRFAVEV